MEKDSAETRPDMMNGKQLLEGRRRAYSERFRDMLPWLVNSVESTHRFQGPRTLGSLFESHQNWIDRLSGKAAESNVRFSTMVQACRARFRGGILRGHKIANRDLRGACFRGADLTGAEFVECNLRYADFADAQVERALFTRCDLRNCEGLQS